MGEAPKNLKNLWDYSRGAPNYGTPETYRRAAEFLDPACRAVEDWGCGGAAAKAFFFRAKYTGIDGSPGFCDVVADLRDYGSAVDGILLRHVLEHNYDWPLILKNAISSFRHRMVLVFFLPLHDYTELWKVNPDGVPNLFVGRIPLLGLLAGFSVREETVPLPPGWEHKAEYIVYVERTIP